MKESDRERVIEIRLLNTEKFIESTRNTQQPTSEDERFVKTYNMQQDKFVG